MADAAQLQAGLRWLSPSSDTTSAGIWRCW